MLLLFLIIDGFIGRSRPLPENRLRPERRLSHDKVGSAPLTPLFKARELHLPWRTFLWFLRGNVVELPRFRLADQA